MLYKSSTMLTVDAVKFFGTKAAIAEALECSPSAVSQWKEMVPPLSAAMLEKISKGKLTFDVEDYRDWDKPTRKAAAN
jgi:transcriptional regulator with XRE-family HTH domain